MGLSDIAKEREYRKGDEQKGKAVRRETLNEW